jgi:predicted enzyme related to lactoylglutathione lyase
MALGVGLLKIPVSDVQVSASFYEAALGLQTKHLVEEYGWAQLDGATVALALYVSGKGGGNRLPGGTTDFHLTSRDLDALHARAIAVSDDVAIHENTDGSRSLEFTDPDGNCIKIMALG